MHTELVKNKKKYSQNLLLIAVILAPFTELRFSMIGPSELIIFYCLFVQLFDKTRPYKLVNFRFTKFWILILSLFIFSSIINTLFFSKYDILDNWFDFVSYLLVFLTVYLFEKKNNLGQISPFLFLKNFFYFFSFLLALLYGISFFTQSILGMPLFYYERFAPLVSNPHKIAIVTSVLPFFGLLILKQTKLKRKRFFVLILILLNIFISILTLTDKAIIGLVLGFVILFVSKFTPKKLKKIFLYIFILVLIYVFVAFNLVGILIDLFNTLDYKGGRSLIYSLGFNKIMLSPVIGYGFESVIFVDGVITDAHQTLFTVALQGGIIALILFSQLLFDIIRKLKSNSVILLAGFMPLLIYILGGDIMRNNYVWIIIILMYYCSSNSNQNKLI